MFVAPAPAGPRATARGLPRVRAFARRTAQFGRIIPSPFRARIARTSCSGLTGVALTSTPNGAKASQTALAIVAGGATAPPSPTPLTPSGLSGEGEYWCTIVIEGMSVAVGNA